VIEEHRGKESYEDFKKLLIGIQTHGAISNAGNKQRQKHKHWILRHTKLGKEERKENDEDHITEISFKRRTKENVRAYEDGNENQYGGNALNHTFVGVSPLSIVVTLRFIFIKRSSKKW
jgi:hypothetical protein